MHLVQLAEDPRERNMSQPPTTCSSAMHPTTVERSVAAAIREGAVRVHTLPPSQ